MSAPQPRRGAAWGLIGVVPPWTLVATGGLVGTALRAAIVGAVPVAAGTFPWGVLIANVSGALALGVLLGALARGPAAERMRLLLGTGVLGAYTTFSALAVDLVLLAELGRGATALGYLAATLVAGLAAAAGGLRLGRRFAGPA